MGSIGSDTADLGCRVWGLACWGTFLSDVLQFYESFRLGVWVLRYGVDGRIHGDRVWGRVQVWHMPVLGTEGSVEPSIFSPCQQ